MYRIHQTADGGSMLIGQMESGHLVNTIRYFCRGILEAKQLLSGQAASHLDPVAVAMSGLDFKSAEVNAQKRIEQNSRLLAEYVLEAEVRGLDTTNILRPALGTAPVDGGIPSILFDSEDDDDDCDEDFGLSNMTSKELYRHLRKHLKLIYRESAALRELSVAERSGRRAASLRTSISQAHENAAGMVLELVLRGARQQADVTLGDLLRAGYGRTKEAMALPGARVHALPEALQGQMEPGDEPAGSNYSDEDEGIPF